MIADPVVSNRQMGARRAANAFYEVPAQSASVALVFVFCGHAIKWTKAEYTHPHTSLVSAPFSAHGHGASPPFSVEARPGGDGQRHFTEGQLHGLARDARGVRLRVSIPLLAFLCIPRFAEQQRCQSFFYGVSEKIQKSSLGGIARS